MITTTIGLVVLCATLAAFAVVGFRAKGSDEGLDDYLVARNSQSGLSLGLSLAASGLGAWILFSPAEVGAFVGADAAIGYGLASAAPLVLFGILGPRVRRLLPDGVSFMGFMKTRFGRTVHATVTAVAIGYMATYLVAELTAIGSVGGLLAGIGPGVTIAAVVVVTLAYTAYGGLRASIITDRWQAWLVLGLAVVAGWSVLAATHLAPGALGDTGLVTVHRTGVESSITLVVAVTAAEMLNHGNWQRVWAARDSRSLAIGVGVSAVLVALMVSAAGLAGTLAVAAGVDLGDPAVPFFSLLTGLPTWVLALVLTLGVGLVASSVDSLENALAALVVAERPSLNLTGARVATVVLVVPAALVAVQGYSVLRLFLVADLLAAAIVAPVLLGLWRRTTPGAALAGIAAGLVGAVVAAVLTTTTLGDALGVVTFEGGATPLAPFAGALLASVTVTIGWSLIANRQTDLEGLVSSAAASG